MTGISYGEPLELQLLIISQLAAFGVRIIPHGVGNHNYQSALLSRFRFIN